MMLKALLLLAFLALALAQASNSTTAASSTSPAATAYTCTDFAGRWQGAESDGSVMYDITISGGNTGTQTTKSVVAIANNCQITVKSSYSAAQTAGAGANNYTLTLTNAQCSGGSCSGPLCDFIKSEITANSTVTQQINFNPANCDQFWNEDGVLLTRTASGGSAGSVIVISLSVVAVAAAFLAIF